MNNLKVAIPAVVARIDGNWDNVQSLHIKTSESVSLPIWTCPLGDTEPGSRWASMTMKTNEEEDWTGFGSGPEQEKSKDMPNLEVFPPAKTASKSVGKKTEQADQPKISSSQPKEIIEIEERESDKNKKRPSGDTTEEDQSAGKKRRRKKQLPEDALERPAADMQGTTETKKGSTPTPLLGDATKGKKKETAIEASISNNTLGKKELKQKKETLESAKLAKKKEKIKDTEKSTRKGVKAKLIGKTKAS